MSKNPKRAGPRLIRAAKEVSAIAKGKKPKAVIKGRHKGMDAEKLAKFKETKDPTGRPSIYSDTLAQEYCSRIAKGRTMAQVCSDPDMPGERTVFRWQIENFGFRQFLAQAREVRGHLFNEQIAGLALGIVSETQVATGPKADPVKVRVAIEGLDKHIRNSRPNRVEIVGRGGGPIETFDLTGLSDEELEQYERTVRKIAGNDGSGSDA